MSRLKLQLRLRTLLLLITASAILLTVCFNWDAIPGTFYRDEHGLPHGTGTELHSYDTGPVMIEERYYRGLLSQSTWRRPDGTVIATEKFDPQTGGIGYHLRQDGTIKYKFTYAYYPANRDYLAHCPATVYRRDGSVEKTVIFEHGSEQEPDMH